MHSGLPMHFNNNGITEYNETCLSVWVGGVSSSSIQFDTIAMYEEIENYDINSLGYNWIKNANAWKYDGEEYYFEEYDLAWIAGQLNEKYNHTSDLGSYWNVDDEYFLGDGKWFVDEKEEKVYFNLNHDQDKSDYVGLDFDEAIKKYYFGF